MSRANRAAQFAPFAALTGHADAVKETARLTEQKIELDDSAVAELDMKLNMLADVIDSQPEIAVTHFVPDTKKEGGAYVTTTGAVKKIDEYARTIVLTSDKKIEISNILDIDSKIFKELLGLYA
ncbi:MAG: hypothetical protein LBR75_00100 [Prevotellaceae bacterium]|jgi:xanthine/CO dehydrogenase XdhC/CoxF family maturation factor|nr:hypothetical protein [Prevotellaceae bacterium]